MFSKIFSRNPPKTGQPPVSKEPTPVSSSSSPAKTKPAPKAKPVSKVAVPAWDINQFVVEKTEGKTRFHDFDLPVELMHAIADLGFSYCSPIQAQSLPHTLRGGDVVGKAQTGTGKTAAFLITVIYDLLKNPVQHERYAGEARAVILAPTRELAIQIGESISDYGKNTTLTHTVIFGGVSQVEQVKKLRK